MPAAAENTGLYLFIFRDLISSDLSLSPQPQLEDAGGLCPAERWGAFLLPTP